MMDNLLQQWLDESPYQQAEHPLVRVRILQDVNMLKNDFTFQQLKAGEVHELTVEKLNQLNRNGTINGVWERVRK